MFLRADGIYQASISLGTNHTGKRLRKYVYSKDEKECLRKFLALKKRYASGQSSSGMRLEAYMQQWLEGKSVEVSKRSHRNYEKETHHYLLPKLGKMPLDKLTTSMIKQFQLQLAKAVSPYMANRVRSLLGNALGDAVNDGLLDLNPATAVKPVKHVRRRFEIWMPGEIEAALEAAKVSRLYALFYLALATGMRRGELAGLHWSRVTQDEIHINQAVAEIDGRFILGTPKRESFRTLPLSQEASEVLTAHRERLAMEASVMKDYRDSGLVFPSEKGTLLVPSNLERTHRRTVELAQVKPIRFHDLRHTYASMMIANGIDVVKLARLLGHESPQVTLRYYSHLFAKHQHQVSPSLSDLAGIKLK